MQGAGLTVTDSLELGGTHFLLPGVEVRLNFTERQPVNLLIHLWQGEL